MYYYYHNYHACNFHPVLLSGAYESTKRGGNSGARKRVNNIWGSVLQEEELAKGIGGLQNQAKTLDDREMGVESYDWRRSLADTRPYVEVRGRMFIRF